MPCRPNGVILGGTFYANIVMLLLNGELNGENSLIQVELRIQQSAKGKFGTIEGNRSD
jgi:hypothetical protein